MDGGDLKNRAVRIGAGCSVDITLSLPQMVRQGKLDYMVIDFMTEGSVARFAGERAADPKSGWGTPLAGPELAMELRQILADGVKVVTNAGGLNPFVCADAVRRLADDLGLNPKIAVVDGDDVRERVEGAGLKDMYSGAELPAALASANAYLGAKPIAEALAKGADIVITGRVVDSAMTLGPLLHAFDWSMEDYDRLAGGTLIGHLLECGAQPTGGIFTDWRDVDWSDSSFPIAECTEDGTAVISKVDGTGGLVSVGSIAEQILYEIGDPQRYYMPEVTCDLSQVTLEKIGEDRIRVSGARGRAPTKTYKVCAMAQEGWRCAVSGTVSGPDAAEKARRMGEAVLTRCQRLFADRNLGDFTDAAVELIGTGDSMGAHAPPIEDPREIVYRIVVDHPTREGAELMAKVSGSAMASMAPGSAGQLGTVLKPRMRMYSCLLDKTGIPVRVTVEGETNDVDVPTSGGFETANVDTLAPLPESAEPTNGTVPLVRLAWVRSGDKGDTSNIGVIARDPRYVPYLKRALTTEAIAAWYRHVFVGGTGQVERFELPGLNAFNFLLHGALDGGVVVSRRFDTMGKGLGQQLIEFPVPVPEALAAELGPSRR